MARLHEQVLENLKVGYFEFGDGSLLTDATEDQPYLSDSFSEYDLALPQALPLADPLHGLGLPSPAPLAQDRVFYPDEHGPGPHMNLHQWRLVQAGYGDMLFASRTTAVTLVVYVLIFTIMGVLAIDQKMNKKGSKKNTVENPAERRKILPAAPDSPSFYRIENELNQRRVHERRGDDAKLPSPAAASTSSTAPAATGKKTSHKAALENLQSNPSIDITLIEGPLTDVVVPASGRASNSASIFPLFKKEKQRSSETRDIHVEDADGRKRTFPRIEASILLCAPPNRPPAEGTPQASPQATPKGTPRATPKGTPRATPKGTPRASPRATPKGTLRAPPQATPEGTPRALPQAEPRTPLPSFGPTFKPHLEPPLPPFELPIGYNLYGNPYVPHHPSYTSPGVGGPAPLTPTAWCDPPTYSNSNRGRQEPLDLSPSSRGTGRGGFFPPPASPASPAPRSRTLRQKQTGSPMVSGATIRSARPQPPPSPQQRSPRYSSQASIVGECVPPALVMDQHQNQQHQQHLHQQHQHQQHLHQQHQQHQQQQHQQHLHQQHQHQQPLLQQHQYQQQYLQQQPLASPRQLSPPSSPLGRNRWHLPDTSTSVEYQPPTFGQPTFGETTTPGTSSDTTDVTNFPESWSQTSSVIPASPTPQGPSSTSSATAAEGTKSSPFRKLQLFKTSPSGLRPLPAELTLADERPPPQKTPHQTSNESLGESCIPAMSVSPDLFGSISGEEEDLRDILPTYHLLEHPSEDPTSRILPQSPRHSNTSSGNTQQPGYSTSLFRTHEESEPADGEGGPCPLQNENNENRCFINAALQLLWSESTYLASDLLLGQSMAREENRNFPAVEALLHFLRARQRCRRGSLHRSADAVARCVYDDLGQHFKLGEHGDASEFLGLYLTEVNKELTSIDGPNLMERKFSHTMVARNPAEQQGSATEDRTFHYLYLAGNDRASFIDDLFEEQSKKTLFSSLPPLLLVQLVVFQRRETRPADGSRGAAVVVMEKKLRKILFDDDLTIRDNWVTDELRRTDCNTRYQLRAMVCHRGPSLDFGHYIACVKSPQDGDNSWYYCDDKKINKTSLNDIMDDEESQPYIILFKKVHTDGDAKRVQRMQTGAWDRDELLTRSPIQTSL